jgi:uncharacterized membrane protein YhaH (DUF805 family)
MNKIEKALVAVKIIFSLFISCLVIFKGDAGSLVNAIGNFIVNGNFIIGLISTITILAIYPLLLHNLTYNVVRLTSLKNKLLTFDMAIIFANLAISIFISNKIYQMPLEDALSKYGILTAGTTVLFIILTIIILAILKKLSTDVSSLKELMCNKNPLSFIGTINRLPYFITKLVLFVMASIPAFYKTMNNQIDEMQFMFLQFVVLQIVFVIAFYTASKRLRDIQWSQWLLLPWAIPFVGLIVGIPLLFVKSKINNALIQE